MSIAESLKESLDYQSQKYVVSVRSSLSVPYQLRQLGEMPQYAVDELCVPSIGWDLDRFVTLSTSQLLLPLLCKSNASKLYRCGAQILLAADEDRVGAAAETLLCDVLDDWCHQKNRYEELCFFEIIAAIEAETLVCEGLWSSLQELAPEVYQKYGEDAVEEWVSSSKLLLIINNWPAATARVNSQNSDGIDDTRRSSHEETLLLKDTIEYYADELRNTKFLIFVSDQRVNDWLGMFNDELGIPTQMIKITRKFTSATAPMSKTEQNLVDWAVDSLWKTNFILRWPKCRQSLIEHLFNTEPSFRSAKTLGDVMWSALQFILNLFKRHENCSLEICNNLFDRLCHLAYDAEHKIIKVNNYFEHVRASSELKPKFLRYFLLILPKYPSAENDSYCLFINSQLQHILAARFVHSNKLSITNSLNRLRSRDDVAVMLLGHIRRAILNNPILLEDKAVHREFKSLYLLNENSKDPQAYLLHMLGELHGENRLVELLFRDAVFPRQLELFDNCLVKEYLLQYVSYVQPRRLLLLVRRGQVPVEIVPIVNALGNLDLSFGLGLMHHLERGSSSTSDEVLLSALSAPRARLQDFLGCLTASAIDKITPSRVTHLTCIRIRVTCETALRKLFHVQSTLPNLMWFETDFDLPFESIISVQLHQIITPLCDFTFFHLSEAQIPSLVKFVLSVRKNYLSGLHVHDTSLNINCAIRLIAMLRENGLTLSTPCEVIVEYRRWRYTEVAVLETQELMDEEKVRPLLGYDDRHQYSDNEIRSNQNVSDSDAEKLMNFLEFEESVTYFQFGCSNVVITKHSDGQIESKGLKRCRSIR